VIEEATEPCGLVPVAIGLREMLGQTSTAKRGLGSVFVLDRMVVQQPAAGDGLVNAGTARISGGASTYEPIGRGWWLCYDLIEDERYARSAM